MGRTEMTLQQISDAQDRLEQGVEDLRQKYAAKAEREAKEAAKAAAAQRTQDALAAQAAAAEEERCPSCVDMTMADPDVEAMRQARMAALKSKAAAAKRAVAEGGGEYREIVEEDFLKEVTGCSSVAVHFYHPEYMTCKVMDKHLSALAPRVLGVRFLKLNATKAPFFVPKLKVRVLPSVVFFVDGVAVGRQTGLQGLVSSATEQDFPTSRLLRVIQAAGLCGAEARAAALEEEDEDDEDGAGGGAGGGGGGGGAGESMSARLARMRAAMAAAALDEDLPSEDDEVDIER